MIVFPGHLNAYDAHRSLQKSLRCARYTFTLFLFLSVSHPCARDNSFFLRDARFFDSGVYTRQDKRYTTPARIPAIAPVAAVWTRLDRRTTAVSNDGHVCTSRYHHSLSSRRQKKKLYSSFNATPIPYQIVTNFVTAAIFLPRLQGNIFNASGSKSSIFMYIGS